MLTGNKVNKYFLFAIGEISLVVIGILIAISIDNWNENRKAINRDFEICEKIIIDLDEDYKVIESTIEIYKNHQDVHYHIYNETQGNAKYDPNLNYSDLRWTITYEPIISYNYSDAAANFKNESIRFLLNKFIKVESQAVQAVEYWNETKIEIVRPYLAQYGIFDSKVVFNDTPYEHLSLHNARIVNWDKLSTLFGTKELDQLLFDLRIKTAYSIRKLKELLEINRQLKLALENELTIANAR